MGHRIVEGLKWARACPVRPPYIPKSRPRGVKALGVRYERRLAEASGGLAGQWFEFEDANGLGCCQTDVIVDLDNVLLVLEAKLSWVPEGHSQIAKLYRPVVEAALVKPVIGIVVVKNLTPGAPRAFGCYDDAIASARTGCLPVLHWLGVAALRPRRTAPPSSHLAAAPRLL